MTSTTQPVTYNKRQLFIVSVIALVTAGIAASIRGNLADVLQHQFLDPIDPVHSAEMIGTILGVAFFGFALTIMIGSPMLDYLGMRFLLLLACFCFITGTLILIFTQSLSAHFSAYRVLWTGALISGIGWGLTETVINPLAVTLYPEDQTHRLNVLHAWWPGGLIIGGLMGLGLSKLNLDWRLQLGCVLVPAVIFGVMLLASKFPPTERVAAGISTGQMMKEFFRPFFLVWFFSMFLTAASELAPGQWVQLALTHTVHMPGILLLVYVSALMFVMRHFAGPMVHKLSPVGLLWCSCLLASLGLFSLSVANSPVTGLLAATVWGTGVCYMWPTMLAAASERFPRGGAVLMGLMGTAGMLSVFFVLPQMGKVYDHYKALSGEVVAAQMSFRVVSVLPAILLFVFGAIWLYDRSKGGFKPQRLTPVEKLEEAAALKK
ncbi:MAG TPA: MFS transporter [Terriglobales bacterium]|nr:MFS transporter [Terriglobales bacterium]